MRRETHSCGLRALRQEPPIESGLRHEGGAGPAWGLVCALFYFLLRYGPSHTRRRTGRTVSITQGKTATGIR